MTRLEINRVGALHGAPTSALLLLVLAVLFLGPASSAHAQATSCSDFGGVLDGLVNPNPPSNIEVDQNCTIRNFPASNPLSTNFNFFTQPGQNPERWLIVFDNVVHTGQMSCNAVLEHKIWFTNGSSTSIQDGCQNLLIPVEKIDKRNPAGQTTAVVGTPFTYTLTMPVLFDPATGTVINSSGSLNDLHGVTITDDLNATGAALTYISHVAYWEDSGAPVSHTFSNVGGVLTFDAFPIIPAGEQIVVELTVVLDDVPANARGTQFVNTAKWDFGRLIDGVFYEPLPGEWGVTQPLTIAAPELVVTKTGPATLGLTLNLGEWGQFEIDAHNISLIDAWNVTLLDRLPDGAAGGMCDVTPEVLSAQVLSAAGTPVPGKGPLVAGSDFSLSYAGAPTCELRLVMLTPASVIGPGEHLVVTYRARLDADSQDGAMLTNVAGATQWFSAAASETDRQAYARTLDNGSVGVADHEDAHTVTVALFGTFFEKSVANLTSGVSPTATAAPGDTLRYTLRLQTTDAPLADFAFTDDLGALNAAAVFVPGSLSLVASSIPPGADASNTNPSGGTNGGGILDVRNLSAPANAEVRIEFDITLSSALLDGTIVRNQADLVRITKIADSDDPNVNGQADPSVPGDEDPTQVVIETAPPAALAKANTQATATIGEAFDYRITVPSSPHDAPLYDVRIIDDLTASAADLAFVAATKVSGGGTWTPVNTGSGTSLVIEDVVGGIDIPAGEQAVIDITVRLLDTSTNVAALAFTNAASYTYDLLDADATSRRNGEAGVTGPMTIVEPDLTLEKSGPPQMRIGVPALFTLNLHNVGGSPAYGVEISDVLPNQADGGMCDAAPDQVTAQLFEEDGATAVAPPLTAGSDFSVAFAGDPACTFTLGFLTPAAAIGPDQRLIVTYRATLDVGTQQAAMLTNVAGATEWFSVDPATSNDESRQYSRVLGDGSVRTLDHEDAHTVNANSALLRFEKTVVNVTRGDPARLASPGETLRYSLRVENTSDATAGAFDLFDELDRLNAPPAFQSGSLTLIYVPAGADTTATSATGGASGTGVIDIRGLSLGGQGDSLLIEFEIVLAPVLANGSSVTNQSQLLVDAVVIEQSDDPDINGVSDPAIVGDEDPTTVTIESAAAFRVEKISTDLTGDPNVLLAGETLRYTITAENIGTSGASDARLRDSIPVNTTYVPGSTTLNGSSVPDAAGGAAPLANGIAINAPSDPTPGVMAADDVVGTDVATLVFDVVVDPAVADGTIISNQAFVSAPLSGAVEQPSDDPGTPAVDDPTRDVVGNAPLLFAAKSVVIGSDGGSPGIVDPLDVLHYTITVTNTGPVPATVATLIDSVPANTTWVADSLRLNSAPVGVPDGGVSPLAAGVAIASSDQPPPPPGATGGILNPGESAVVEFDLQVAAGTPGGTLISNQAVVGSAEAPNLLTDGDGNPATGPEPTVVVVGAGQQLTISKQVAVVGGGAALAGGQLEYEVRVTNVASVPAQNVLITDDLDSPVAGQLVYVPGSATLDGVPTGVSVVDPLLRADYFANYGPLQPGASAVLRFRADIVAGQPIGTVITNTGVVSWNAASQTASASVSIAIGGVPGLGAMGGTVWHDADFDNTLGTAERALENWRVELLRNGAPVGAVMSDAAGVWNMSGLAPNDLNGDAYVLRFSAPGALATSAALGVADSPFTDALQRISGIVLPPGSNLQNLNLPIDPNGVVYDSLARVPVAGATLTLLPAGGGAALPASCFDDAAQQGQVTRSDGFYKFDLNFTQAACSSPAAYEIALSLPAGGAFESGFSQIIPPQTDASTAAFDVPGCPGTATDAVSATAQHCEVQASALAPPAAVPPQTPGTAYHTHLLLVSTASPGTSQLFNNHLPVDPVIFGNIAVTKTTPSREVSRGDLVPYEITVRNELVGPIPDLTLVDRFPAGFRYIAGSARVDGVPTEPTHDPNTRELVFTDVGIDGAGTRSVALLLAVGAGVGDGNFTNLAQAVSSLTGNVLSGEASATVRVVPDPDFACTDVYGKVFDDRDRDGSQSAGERGLAGARVVTARGLVATTDPHGRFHITCATVPNEDRGSNFILKLDERSLPSGYRMSTRVAQVKRATAGKALRFDFGASVHRIVALDLADDVFEPDSTTMREQWTPRIDLLLDAVAKAAATLRLAYVGDLEDSALVERRLDAVEAEVVRRWTERSDEELLVEREIYWRRGAPAGMSSVAGLGDKLLGALESPWRGDKPRAVDSVAGAERHLPSDTFTAWTQDPERFATDVGDRLEEREVVTQQAETAKLKGVVPPIRFASGAADIPASTVDALRTVLDDMRHLPNVRLHLLGHADDQPLRPSLAAVYGDNEGLSRERAGEVAEFLHTALELPPGAISFAYAGDREPVASNASEAGRAQNRRVEVEVWYDEKHEALALEEVVVSAETKRVKVCRTETVCKLRYREGHERRARVRNLIAPLHVAADTTNVPTDFVDQVRQALANLGDRQNVTVKFIGYTDDTPLEGRASRIYGTHLAVSKARAHRVARAIQERLRLRSSAVVSEGYGAAYPIASNSNERGRALNQRVAVEFWYDDPLQELPDEPQPCPDPADAELVTKVYDPPWGRIEPIAIEDGAPRIPAGYQRLLVRALDDVERELPDAINVRLRFVGYTRNERLDRRIASVYGDDVGLSAARAQRTREQVLELLARPETQAEHEGRGYVHSNDVVNAGFLQGDTDQVAVQVVYDEPGVIDDRDGIDIMPLTRELRPSNPLSLNLMHITVDGQPLDDPGRSSADIQRCTDVALDAADIRFEFDELDVVPRLSVTSSAGSVTVSAGTGAAGMPAPAAFPVPAAPTASDSRLAGEAGEADEGVEGEMRSSSAAGVEFRMSTNYGNFVERSEVRIFERGQSVKAEPLAVVAVDEAGAAYWQPPSELATTPVRELFFVLRAYDATGRFDETAPQVLWLLPVATAPSASASLDQVERGVLPTAPDALLAGYGETGPLHRGIPFGGAGVVRVRGQGIPPGHTVWLAGTPVPTDSQGRFVAEAVLPQGMHTVEVAVLDPSGGGELFLRDLEIARDDWFYVGIADLTLSAGITSGPEQALQGAGSTYDRDSWADGRLAFFLKGRFGDGWGLTASADTREGPVQDLFKDFVDKTPEALFRRIDSDYSYPTFGDDGTVEEAAPTSGKFYVKLKQRENHAMWGNFKVGYLENELAQVDRGLYGANLHYQTPGTTLFGEQRVVLDGFAAQPGTVPSREEFRGTGGSVYYLRVQDLLEGSDRLRIETRDKDSGLVNGVVHLRQTTDYDIDYLQGRILLTEPLSAHANDNTLVRKGGLDGDEVWLVVQYEFTPGIEELDNLAAGGQGHAWLTDFLRVGATANYNDNSGVGSSLYAGDLILRGSAESWLKLQYGRSDGVLSTSLRSDDGGFNFQGAAAPPILAAAEANGYRADLSVGFADILPEGWGRGRLALYAQMLEAGYSAPGQSALFDTQQYGGVLEVPLTERLLLHGKSDRRDQENGLDTTAAELDLRYDLTKHWSMSAGVRYDDRQDDSPVVPLTQEQGERTDGVVQIGFDSGGTWSGYAFGQGTLAKSGDRDDNHRYGAGGAVRIGDRMVVDGEVSHGASGPALRVGTSFQQTAQAHRYLSYALENERGIDGTHQRRGSLISGMRSRLSDSGSVYVEDRFQHSGAQNGLSRAMGLTLSPSERWSVSGVWDLGTLIDRDTQAETERRSGGISAGYRFEDLQLSLGVEYRDDDVEQLDTTHTQRTTWLLKGSLKYQMTPDWRVLSKFNRSWSDSSEGTFYDGGYTEFVLGYAFRPVEHDRLNVLAKYTWFSNMPTTSQFTSQGVPSQFIQRSHVASLDVSYDLTPAWSVGGKYAFRRGEVSLDRIDPQFFANDAHLYVLRTDYRFLKDWEVLVEGRLLALPDLDERRTGALFSISRYLGEHFKVGVGYNFADFSDDLTDLSYDHHGFFFTFTGSL